MSNFVLKWLKHLGEGELTVAGKRFDAMDTGCFFIDICLTYVTFWVLKGSLKNSQFGPAVWPAIANIYTNIHI